ncbi:restriction endonuclease subunit S [Bacillus halotolerans]|uniref:Restriction endonuclease subunit S n=1 Tax=Bacillus halotolerans TaxID=260554 RepID=A0A9Q6F3H4_9BACI|nr:restriction endonuclease subunit S [Bacillus halotolerans]PLS09834.1 restriction endonuclease subunit S [Bacillus halotolerans]
MENNNTPEVRFPGYSGCWEKRKLGEMSESFEYGLNASATEYDGENKYIRITDIDDITHKFLEDNLTSPNIDLSSAGNYLVKEGDILFARTGASVGKTYIYDNKDGKVYFAGFLIRARIKSGYDPGFIFQNTLTTKYNEFIKITSQRSGQPGVNAQQYASYLILVPNNDEQTKIGNFFKQLDDTIALHQQELTTLKQTKQGFLQKMFPKEGESVPEVRFPEFTGDWEQHKLDSIVDRVKSYSLSRDVETTEYTGYKYIHYGDIHTKVADIIDEFSDLPNIKAGNYELLKKGDLVLADASEDYKGIAAPAVITIDVPYKLVSGLHTIALRPKQIDSLFLYYLINSQTFRKYGYKAGTGMKVFGISATNLLRFESLFPIFEEQTKIGNFFKQLDDTIALHQRELDALKETKKAFLQKMFV